MRIYAIIIGIIIPKEIVKIKLTSLNHLIKTTNEMLHLEKIRTYPIIHRRRREKDWKKGVSS